MHFTNVAFWFEIHMRLYIVYGALYVSYSSAPRILQCVDMILRVDRKRSLKVCELKDTENEMRKNNKQR